MSKEARTSSVVALVLLAWFGAAPAAASSIEVPEDHETIAVALAAASHGDTVSLAPGTYYEHDLLLPPGVSLVGRSASPEAVVIDAQALGRVMMGEDLDEQNVLANFTARAGSTFGVPGAGLYLSGPCTLRNLIVEECGTTGRGAGAHCRYPLLIEDCVFRNNRCTGTESSAGGLYIVAIAWTGSIVHRTDFIGNEAYRGAAIMAYAAQPITFESVRIFNNKGRSAVWLYSGESDAYPSFRLQNVVIAHNSGVGVSCTASGWIVNSTIVGCGGGITAEGGTWSSNTVYIDNCLVAFNDAESDGAGIRSLPSTYAGYIWLTCSNVFGNTPANYAGMLDPTGQDGNLSKDPLFCPEAGPEDYFLRPNSPCAPANNSCGVQIGAFPVGCESTSTAQKSWSAIKALY